MRKWPTAPLILITIGMLATACDGDPVPHATPTGASTEAPVATGLPETPVPSPSPDSPQFANIVDEFGVEMALVPEGVFTMGTDDEAADAHERPAHEVYTDSVYVDIYEATNSLYQACVGAGACPSPLPVRDYQDNPDFADYPAVNVTWEMANAYCAWRGARLPTEAEWEKAARWNPISGSSSLYPWGNEPPTVRLANTGGADVGGTTLVGSYERGRSALGLYDMAGNVWEWVSDAYAFDTYATSPGINPTGPDHDTGSRVLRGGSYGDADFYARATARVGERPNLAPAAVGVRCAKEP